MSSWVQLLGREVLVMLVLGAAGMGFVAFLPRCFDRTSRIALAPLFGFCATSAPLLTSMWLVPARKGWPLLVLLVIVSVLVAVFAARSAAADDHNRQTPLRIGFKSGAMLLVLVGLVLVTFTAPIAERNSTGPVGGYVYDAAGYQTEIDGSQSRSIRTSARETPQLSDLTLLNWSSLTRGSEVFGDTAVAAHLASATGLHGSDIQTSFLIALVAACSLGLFAVIRVVSGSTGWILLVGPLLMLGPFFRQLVFDGSQGAVGGLAIVVPTCVIGWLALRYRSVAAAILTVVLLAGLSSTYPLMLPPVLAAASAAVVVEALRCARRGKKAAGAMLIAGALATGATAVLASPVAFFRNLDYVAFASNASAIESLPKYDLRFEVIPGWLTQTREFYEPRELGGIFQQYDILLALLAIVVPALALIAAGYAVYRRPPLGYLIIVILAATLLGGITSSEDCSYCTQRNLLVIAPVLMTLVGVAVVVAADSGPRLKAAAAVVATVLLAVAFSRGFETAARTYVSAFSLNQDVENLLSDVTGTRPLLIEGFGQSALAAAEMPFTYHRANESLINPLSTPIEQNDFNGLAYLGGARTAGPEFRPDYQFVLSRFGFVDDGRKLIARQGPIALQERTADLDAIVAGGPQVALASQDPTATAWLTPGRPLTIWVVGGGKSTAYLRLTIRTTVPVRLQETDVQTRKRASADRLELCSRVPFAPFRRGASYVFRFQPVPPPAVGRFATPLPARGASLESVKASRVPCS